MDKMKSERLVHPAARVASAVTALSLVGCAIQEQAKPTAASEVPTETSIEMVEVPESARIAEVVGSLNPWKNFSMSGNPVEMVGQIKIPLNESRKDILFVNPEYPDGAANLQVEYSIVRTTLLAEGEEYETPFLIKKDKTLNTVTAYMLQFSRIEESKTFYEVGEVDKDKNAHLAPFEFVVDASEDIPKFQISYKSNQAEEQLVSPEPTAIPEIVNVAFNPSQEQPPINLTPTPEIEPVFVPEGFAIGELGLLRDPATGKDVLQFNPDADWKAFRQMTIENIWQANKDWADYTGEQSDASRMTKEEFLEKALAGEELTFGIPVRNDEELIVHGPRNEPPKYVEIRQIKAKLDIIGLQVLEPGLFKQYLGDWYDKDQQAYSPLGGKGEQLSSSPAHFGVNMDGRILISVGNFNFNDSPSVPSDYLIGRFDSSLHNKYESLYDERGIGLMADNAASITLGFTISQLEYLKDSFWEFETPSGTKAKVSVIAKTTTAHYDDSWSSWSLFVFNQ